MATTYERRKRRQNTIFFTIVAVLLICAVFFAMVSSFYIQAEEMAYENLHVQTKQIKDDLILQIKSDRENLVTMANFAAKLYADGEGYDLMFESFKPIGLFSNIGILNPDNTFSTKVGTIDLKGKISFVQESLRGEYISGRIVDLTGFGGEIIRSAVPIKVKDQVVGILYGVIRLETIGEKYTNMAKELDAQLFVYSKEDGKFFIDTIDKNPGELSNFGNRKFNKGYSYYELVNGDKGFSSFKSKFTGENLYIHYSTIEDFGWGIMLARYESQVFAETHKITKNMIIALVLILLIAALYLQLVMKKEKDLTKLNAETSVIRQFLLDTNDQYTNITESLKKIKEFANARSAFFGDTDGEDFAFIKPSLEDKALRGKDREFFYMQLFGYAAKLGSDGDLAIRYMRIVPDRHLEKTNQKLYDFMIEHNFRDVSFAVIVEKNNLVSIIGVVNPSKKNEARSIIEDVAYCFTIAMNNKKYLSSTEHAATTDPLTGAMNRVAYKRESVVFDREKPEDFACVYVDVNELHIRNNKYGHAAGDEMLIYIANSLKEVFFGHHVYRMGGDEFLVFTKKLSTDEVKEKVEVFVEQLKPKGYKVATGISYRKQNTDCEEMVREAEVRMYEAKAQYYLEKDSNIVAEDENVEYLQMKTGIREIDATISVLKERYNGIYSVSLDDDRAHRILMPAYFGYNEDEDNFSKLLVKYVNDVVHPDYHRVVTSFLNYDAIKRQLADDKSPTITYKKVNGETVVLNVYNLGDDKDNVKETLWVFARD